MHGIDAIRTGAVTLGHRNPVAHHVTTTVITPVDDDTASARSKGIGVTSDGKTSSVTYRTHSLAPRLDGASAIATFRRAATR